VAALDRVVHHRVCGADHFSATSFSPATTRCAAELGYQVTLVRAATAAHMAEEAGLGTVRLP
jgi:hypothetical protein